MKAEDIRKYLRPSSIMGRKSTFANAFASSLAHHDAYSAETVADAIRDLGQDPGASLSCVYCGEAAATWDHVFNLVSKGEFSGYGHQVRNLVPACRTCNERKGQKLWRDWLDVRNPADKAERVATLERFLSRASLGVAQVERQEAIAEAELKRFREIRAEIFRLMQEADALAGVIRSKVAAESANP